MPYQIKSTPYFQRMLTTSKQNGQLQMLKEEYERMSIFNERKIEMRMREVRLNRLKREIEKTMNYNSKRRRLNQQDMQKTKQDELLENFKRARNLGQHFSECNYRKAKIAGNMEDKLELVEEKVENPLSVVLKRIQYGNEISKRNMEKLYKIKRRKEYKANQMFLTVFNSNIKRQQTNKPCFQQQQNPINILEDNPKTTERLGLSGKDKMHKTLKQINSTQLGVAKNSSVLSLSENVHFIDLESIDIPLFENYENMRDVGMSRTHQIQNVSLNKASYYWHKLATAVKLQFIDNKRIKADPQANIQSHTMKEMVPVTKETNIFKDDPISKKLDKIITEQNGIIKRGWNDEYLFKAEDSEFSSYSSSVPHPIVAQIDVNSASGPFSNHQPVEPILRNVKQANNYSFSVGKLRQLFEFQNK